MTSADDRAKDDASADVSTVRRVLHGIALIMFGLFVAFVAFVAVRDVGEQLRQEDEKKALESRFTSGGDQAHEGATLKNEAPVLLAGMVRTIGSEPVPNARVCAANANLLTAREAQGLCVDADDRGHYEFTELLPATYLITAHARGYQPGSAQDGRAVRLAPSERRAGIDIVLRPGGEELVGVVEDATGGPVPEARVRVMQLLSTVTLSFDTHTDEDGRFSVFAAPGQVAISVNAQGYAASTAHAVAPSEVEIVLYPAGGVRGQVVSALDGEPIEGVTVYAVSPGTAVTSGPFGVSDDLGDFSISGLSQGDFVLHGAGGRFSGRSMHPFSLRLGERLEGLTLQVNEGIELHGRVFVGGRNIPCSRGYVALGAPDVVEMPESAAERAELASIPKSEIGPFQISHIDSDGNVSFPGVPAATYYVTMKCVGHVLASGPRVLRVSPSSPHSFEWTVVEGADLTVRVQNGAARPVPYARLKLQPVLTGHVEGPLLPCMTEADGSVRLRGVRPGEYRVLADGEAAIEPTPVVRVKRGEVTEVTLRLKDAGSALISVRSDEGQAVNDVQVSLSRSREQDGTQSATSGEENAPLIYMARALGAGRFGVNPLPPGTYRVQVLPRGGVPGSTLPEVESSLQIGTAASAEIALQVSRSGRIEGRVIGAQGEPLANVQITASSIGEVEAKLGAHSNVSRPVLSDVDGQFTISGLTARGTYQLRAEEVGGTVLLSGPIAAGTRASLRMQAPASLSGTVVDEVGRPHGRYLVRVVNSDVQSEQTSSVLSGSGEFSFERVTPGKVTLILIEEHPDAAPMEHHLELAPGQARTQLKLVLPRRPEGATTQTDS